MTMPAVPFPKGDANPRRQAIARGEMKTRGPNKMPKDVASAIIEALRIAGARKPHPLTGKRVHQSRGMINFFASLSDELLCGLVARLLPRDIGVTFDGEVHASGQFQHVHSARDQRRDELQQQLLDLHKELEALPADADVPAEQLVLLDQSNARLADAASHRRCHARARAAVRAVRVARRSDGDAPGITNAALDAARRSRAPLRQERDRAGQSRFEVEPLDDTERDDTGDLGANPVDDEDIAEIADTIGRTATRLDAVLTPEKGPMRSASADDSGAIGPAPWTDRLPRTQSESMDQGPLIEAEDEPDEPVLLDTVEARTEAADPIAYAILQAFRRRADERHKHQHEVRPGFWVDNADYVPPPAAQPHVQAPCSLDPLTRQSFRQTDEDYQRQIKAQVDKAFREAVARGEKHP